MARKAGRKKDNTVLVVIIVIAIIIFFLAILFPTVFNTGDTATDITAVPTVTTVVRSTDGEAHSVQADISLDINSKARGGVDASTLQNRITDIISTMDYEKIRGKDSTKYIKTTIAEGLEGYVSPEDINGVYITSLKTGDSVVIEETTPGQKKADSVVKGLFQNVK